MIITLSRADFSNSNIGTLSTWSISRVLGSGATYSGATFVDKNAALNATITIINGYELGSAGVTVTMGGVAVTSGVTVNENTITIAIGSVTGNVVIKVPTVNTSTGEEDGEITEVIRYAFPLRDVALGVTSTGTGRVSTTTTRLSNASTTECLGILVPAGETITLYGLASGTYPLRFDYLYGTSAGTNPASGSTTAIEGLAGTASNYVADNYFPCNTSGADTCSVTNNFGADYYFFFAFAGLTKSELITAEFETYNITYSVSSNSNTNPIWIDLPVTELALGVTSTGTGRATDGGNRFSTASTTVANGILIPNGKSMHIKGLASGTYPLRFDYLYGTSNVVNPASDSTTAIEGLVGTASNYIASDYFPCNINGTDAYIVTNNFGADYYFWFAFAGLTKSELIQAELNTYNIKYYIA